MLTIYRRHRKDCPQAADRISRKCRCALWATGSLDGLPYRKTLKTRSFERAQQLVRDLENGNQKEEKQKARTITAALAEFAMDCEQRNLARPTLKKLQFLSRCLAKFAEERGVVLLADLSSEIVRAFRSTRRVAPRTAAKELERLRSIFKFFSDNGWIERNPAKAMKAPITWEKPVEPFTAEEQRKIITTAYRMSLTQEKPSAKSSPIHPKTGTFAKFLLSTALRITDAAILTKERIENGRLFLYAAKNRKPVSIPLPDDLLAELEAIKEFDLFRSPGGSQRPETVSDYWRDQLRKVFKKAGIKNGKPHRFRHTMVVNMLNAGCSIEDCAAVLGDTVTIVQKHYAPFCQSRQDRIDSQLKKLWAPAPLVRVK